MGVGCNPDSQCKREGKCACCGLYSVAYLTSMKPEGVKFYVVKR